MRINHKFLTVNPTQNSLNWDNRFYTEKAILKNIDIYKPEILFLGTFNPDLKTNPADFFYGRNFFWTGFKNLFIHNKIELYGERLEYCPYDPALTEVFELIEKLRLTFTDLIQSLFTEKDQNTLVLRSGKEYILYEGKEYNPIKDSDLEKLDRKNKVNWNTDSIIEYLKLKKSITKLVFTRSLSGRWTRQIEKIKSEFKHIDFIYIYTPSGQGGALHKQTLITNEGKMKPLLRHWTKNNNGNYGNLNHNNWLTNNGVDIANF